MKLPAPYYADDLVTLYHGDARDLLPLLPKADASITDPPYNETHLAWDVWPTGWPSLVAALTDQLWCFGSLRMFLEERDDFASWKLGQDVIWEKHNGSNMVNDRFKRVHESAVHFFRGDWSSLYIKPQFTNDATPKQVRRKKAPKHWGNVGDWTYTSEDGGPRMMRSVLYVRSCHGYATNETQKPEDIIVPILRYNVPPGGLVIDPFAGSGTTLAVARREGRRAIGIELRESQCKDIVARLAQRELPLGATP